MLNFCGRYPTCPRRLRQGAQDAAARDRQAQGRIRGHRRPPVRDGPLEEQRAEAPEAAGAISTAPPRRAEPRHRRVPALSMLRQIRGGWRRRRARSRNWETALQPVMFRALLHWWLGCRAAEREAGRTAIELAEQAGFDFIAAQIARCSAPWRGRARAARDRAAPAPPLCDLALWFEREQPWERQLNALISLQPAVTRGGNRNRGWPG